MAAGRPLLVVHDEEEGHLVYDLLVDEEEMVVAAACSPRPVARFPSQSAGCPAFAASGGAVLGAFYDFWSDTVFHDTVMQVGGYGFWERQASPRRMRDADGRLVQWWPKGRRFSTPRSVGTYRDAPAMLPLSSVPPGPGDAAVVVRMDTILFDGIYVFEKLRLLPAGGCGCSWHAVPLPKPPVGRLAENELAFVTAYCAVGTRVWISVAGKGTFSLDAADDDEHSATWRTEGTWQLPFQGRGLHVPELGSSVIGLTAADDEGRGGFLCACDVRTGAVQHVWLETFPRPWEECVISSSGGRVSRPRDMHSLAYLGDGRFCICRPMSTMKPTMYGPPMTYDACCFLVVELKRLSSSSSRLELVKRGKMTYMWPPRGRQSPYMGFIHTAT
ncbi:hypothetical protein BDA96_08G025600 [Sorghum bicolor]|jgi:hypothetical protein|uniref:Uncharacterized protein n=1 Tax=Sorghum bicolor TaxID=4558 RepID=A0A921QG84_SORBI|nr:hypothetical protein BDA96_08G025600 [Sorghum bicolor]